MPLCRPAACASRTRLHGLLVVAALLGAMSAPASAQREPTTQTSIGVFYLPGGPRETNLWREGDEGSRLFLKGQVLGVDNEPIGAAQIELWHADAAGGVDESRYRSVQLSGADGSFGIKTILPGHIARAIDYPVFAPRHIHVVVTHPQHEPLVSLIYFKGDERLAGGPYPELAIVLEQANEPETPPIPGVPAAQDRDANIEVLFGRVELVLRRAR